MFTDGEGGATPPGPPGSRKGQIRDMVMIFGASGPKWRTVPCPVIGKAT